MNRVCFSLSCTAKESDPDIIVSLSRIYVKINIFCRSAGYAVLISNLLNYIRFFSLKRILRSWYCSLKLMIDILVKRWNIGETLFRSKANKSTFDQYAKNCLSARKDLRSIKVAADRIFAAFKVFAFRVCSEIFLSKNWNNFSKGRCNLDVYSSFLYDKEPWPASLKAAFAWFFVDVVIVTNVCLQGLNFLKNFVCCYASENGYVTKNLLAMAFCSWSLEKSTMPHPVERSG